MNKKIFKLYLIFIISFLVIFILPKPDLRIERIKHSNTNNNILIIGSSVLNHQSPCDKELIKVSDYFKNQTFISEGGLLIEEINLAIGNNKYTKKIILVITPYQLYQPNYYSQQSHFYYRQNSTFNTPFFYHPLMNKPLWRLNEDIKINNTYINRGDAATHIKHLYAKERCNNFQNYNDNILEAVYQHTNNNFIENDVQYRYLSELNSKFDLQIIVVPVYIDQHLSNNIIDSHNFQINSINLNFEKLDIKYMYLNLQNDIFNYDEPWCMCGHLSEKGRSILIKSINSLL